MIDRIDGFVRDGGPHGLGFIQGSKPVDPADWFFKAHFHQDPVWPGSLGLESFLQLLKVVAMDRLRERPFFAESPSTARIAGSTAARCCRDRRRRDGSGRSSPPSTTTIAVFGPTDCWRSTAG